VGPVPALRITFHARTPESEGDRHFLGIGKPAPAYAARGRQTRTPGGGGPWCIVLPAAAEANDRAPATGGRGSALIVPPRLRSMTFPALRGLTTGPFRSVSCKTA